MKRALAIVMVGAALAFLMMGISSSPHQPTVTTLAIGKWSDLRAWPDGSGRKVLIVYSQNGLNLFVMDTRRAVRHPVVLGLDPNRREEGYDVRDVQWSPRGDQVAIEIVSDDVAETFLWSPSTGSAQRIAFGPIASSSPRWDPSGEVLFLMPGVVDPEHDDGLYVYDLRRRVISKILAGVRLNQIDIAGGRLIALRSVEGEGNSVITASLSELRRMAMPVAKLDRRTKKFLAVGAAPTARIQL